MHNSTIKNLSRKLSHVCVQNSCCVCVNHQTKHIPKINNILKHKFRFENKMRLLRGFNNSTLFQSHLLTEAEILQSRLSYLVVDSNLEFQNVNIFRNVLCFLLLEVVGWMSESS